MEKNMIAPSIYKFYSIANLYKGLSEPDLCLQIYQYGNDAVEVKLNNMDYGNQRNALRKQLTLFIPFAIIYSMLLLFKTLHFLNIDIFLISWSMLLLWRVSHLVECEKLIFCNDFGIHLQIQKLLGTNNQYISASNIHDIVINEVLEDLDFRYLLILRTKGVLFNKKPIVNIFKVFKPSYECLSMVYKHLHKVKRKSI